MCLGIPMEIISVDGKTAEVAQAGVRRQVNLSICDETPEEGDYVIVHAGFAIYRLEPETAKESLELLSRLGIEEAQAQ